jgi:hypothetical protein
MRLRQRGAVIVRSRIEVRQVYVRLMSYSWRIAFDVQHDTSNSLRSPAQSYSSDQEWKEL